MGLPAVRAWACATENNCARRSSSRRSFRASLLENAAILTVVVAMPIMSKTINTSISENPCCLTIELSGPGADIDIVAFTASLPVGAQGKNIDFPVHTWIKVLIWRAPGIIGQMELGRQS